MTRTAAAGKWNTNSCWTILRRSGTIHLNTSASLRHTIENLVRLAEQLETAAHCTVPTRARCCLEKWLREKSRAALPAQTSVLVLTPLSINCVALLLHYSLPAAPHLGLIKFILVLHHGSHEFHCSRKCNSGKLKMMKMAVRRLEEQPSYVSPTTTTPCMCRVLSCETQPLTLLFQKIYTMTCSDSIRDFTRQKANHVDPLKSLNETQNLSECFQSTIEKLQATPCAALQQDYADCLAKHPKNGTSKCYDFVPKLQECAVKHIVLPHSS